MKKRKEGFLLFLLRDGCGNRVLSYSPLNISDKGKARTRKGREKLCCPYEALTPLFENNKNK